jgi:hypothetical protein
MLTLLLAMLFGLAAATEAPASDPCARMAFTFNMSPAFHPSSDITVRLGHGPAEVKVVYGDVRERRMRTEVIALDDTTALQFCSRIAQVATLPPTPDNRVLTDGIAVRGSLESASSAARTFSFRSPDPGGYSRESGLADAVFSLFESVNVSCELNEYLEQLAGYFRFGLGARVLRGPPLTIRLYGALSVSDEASLRRLLAGLPPDNSIRFDLTNFDGMGTLVYEDFRPLLERIPPVRWIAGSNLASMLAEIGARARDVELVDGPHCAGLGGRFSRR